jgi:hypothetical protein
VKKSWPLYALGAVGAFVAWRWFSARSSTTAPQTSPSVPDLGAVSNPPAAGPGSGYPMYSVGAPTSAISSTATWHPYTTTGAPYIGHPGMY